VLLISSTRFDEHVTPPGHPERPERAHVLDVVAADYRERGGTVIEPIAATREQLARVHTAEHLDRIAGTTGRPMMLDADTFTSPASHEIASLAAGAAVQAARHAVATGEIAFALVRPPGHHAEADKPMGFCLYNNVAVAAADAIASGLQRVAIVDIDVHHGNGTQWMFYDDPSVLFVSSHQYPFYPGTGAAAETGRGAGVGYTVNLPIEVGATDADFDAVYREAVIPALQQFEPELILVSAGFDAHELDPLAGMRMTTAGYGQLTARLLAAADELCDGRIVFVTEGGYDTGALAACCQGVIDLASAESVVPPLDIAGDTRRGQDAIRGYRRAHQR
jgi:acetoin utilization deacetylase AcuC-like enzyme